MAVKVLVVDDEPDFCEAVREFLEGRGYDVVEVYSGDEAVVAYKQERPDMVLLDIRMPGKDGIETLWELRAFDPEANVIMVTAVHEKKLAKKAMAEGAFDYITKPINYEYLDMALKTRAWLSGDYE